MIATLSLPVGAWLAPASRSNSLVPRSARRTPPPALLHRDWRVFGVEVPVDLDDKHTSLDVSERLRHALAERLGLGAPPPLDDIQLVRKSLDARPRRAGGRRGKLIGGHEVAWSYVVDVKLDAADAKRLSKQHQPGRLVPAAPERVASSTIPAPARRGARVIVVGAGPCGLFAALKLAQAGMRPVVIERGKPVRDRAKDIGALTARRVLNGESNFCYGEGGAGTWSDGKLTTRIGRNSEEVREVLATLVRFGAPSRILLDGKPHLGTDNLVRLLQGFRKELIALGGEYRWSSRVERLIRSEDGDGRVVGVGLADGSEERGEAVVLAAGHSARELYAELVAQGATLAPKIFAVGFRVEHPQAFVNAAQYGDELAKNTDTTGRGYGLPAASYRMALGTADAEKGERGCYSFCMCPGGQVVPTSLEKGRLCINGMSFSNRASRWANSAVVVSVGAEYGDLGPEGDLRDCVGGGDPLAGLRFQEEMEARAAEMGGGDLECPVQRVPDFLEGKLSTEPLPRSSYRLGVRPAPLHELYPPAVTEALREALRRWGRTMPGFASEDALLHGVETRTSAPVQVQREGATFEALGLPGLYPAGEGAGYAGGIVSAAVDGLRVGRALAEALGATEDGESAAEPEASE